MLDNLITTSYLNQKILRETLGPSMTQAMDVSYAPEIINYARCLPHEEALAKDPHLILNPSYFCLLRLPKVPSQSFTGGNSRLVNLLELGDKFPS